MTKQFRWSDNYLVWTVLQSVVMAGGAFCMRWVLSAAGPADTGKSIMPSSVLLSVAAAVAVQLWTKLNDLSSLAGLESAARERLAAQVRVRVRSLVWLVVYFTAFLFFVLTAVSLSATSHWLAEPLLIGTGAGFGACVVLMAAMLVDLNEIAELRWRVEGEAQVKAKREKALADLSVREPGFENDPHIQGYKRVINGD